MGTPPAFTGKGGDRVREEDFGKGSSRQRGCGRRLTPATLKKLRLLEPPFGRLFVSRMTERQESFTGEGA